MQQVELPTDYQKFIHQSRYARWKEEDSRRETWEETVSRYFDFMTDHLFDNFDYTAKTLENLGEDSKELLRDMADDTESDEFKQMVTALSAPNKA